MPDIQEADLNSDAGVRRLLKLFTPLLFVAFSNCIFLVIEKLLLARLSTEAMEAAVNSAYACQIFQGSCVALAMMAQVFIGRWNGAGELKLIGPGLWQFIWFSVLSMVVTLPLGIFYCEYYFWGLSIKALAEPYYTFLMGINFLYPLGAALSCFYLGQGKTRLILGVTLFSQAIKLVLAYVFIFGWGSLIPSMGILGGAISTMIAQGFFCAILLGCFLNKKNTVLFNTRDWKFNPKLFWECIYPGLLRVCNRVLNFTSWAAIARLMTVKGGDYLLFVSIGGTFFMFLTMFVDATCQALVTVISNLLGTRSYSLLKKAFRSGIILVISIVLLTTIPLLLFPSLTFNFLFPTIHLEIEMLRPLLFGIWLSFAFLLFNFIPISDILAFKDMNFSFFMGFFNWINGYLFMYFAIHQLQIKAEQFWIFLSVMHGTTALIYLWRSSILRSRLLVSTPKPTS